MHACIYIYVLPIYVGTYVHLYVSMQACMYVCVTFKQPYIPLTECICFSFAFHNDVRVFTRS